MSGPTQIAVDEATGELYVVDGGNERVDVFKPGAGGGYEYVTQFKVRSPGAIAVDNSRSAWDPSRGDVYVVGAEEKEAEPSDRDIVYEYSPSEGRVVEKLQTFQSGEVEEEFEDISGLAVDPNEVLWVYWEEEGIIDGFAKQLNKAQSKTELVWQRSLRRTPEVESKFECSASRGFAVAPGDEAFYVGYERESAAEGCPARKARRPIRLQSRSSTTHSLSRGRWPAKLTVRTRRVWSWTPLSGVVYLDNGSSVGAFTASGALIQGSLTDIRPAPAAWRWTLRAAMCSSRSPAKTGSMSSGPKQKRTRR